MVLIRLDSNLSLYGLGELSIPLIYRGFPWIIIRHVKRITVRCTYNRDVMNLKLLLIISVALICGCSANQTKKTSQPLIDTELLNQGLSEIKIYRPDDFLQMLANVRVKLDGQYAATLSNEAVSTIQLKPGHHMLASSMEGLDFKGDCPFSISLEPGEVQYVSLSPTTSGAALPIVSILMNPLVCKFEMKEVSELEGKKQYESISKNQ